MEIKKGVHRGILHLCCNGEYWTLLRIDLNDKNLSHYSQIMLNNEELAIVTTQFFLLCKLKGIPIEETLKLI